MNVRVYMYTHMHTHAECTHTQTFLAANYKYLETPEKQELRKGEAVRYPTKTDRIIIIATTTAQ